MTWIIREEYLNIYLALVNYSEIMKIILLLIIISLLVAGGFLFAFFWAVKDGQYADDFTPSMRILIDDDMISPDLIDEKLEFTINEKQNH